MHDLHVWALSTTETALTAHLVLPEDFREPDGWLEDIISHLESDHGIGHSTIQVERSELTCSQAHCC